MFRALLLGETITETKSIVPTKRLLMESCTVLRQRAADLSWSENGRGLGAPGPRRVVADAPLGRDGCGDVLQREGGSSALRSLLGGVRRAHLHWAVGGYQGHSALERARGLRDLDELIDGRGQG